MRAFHSSLSASEPTPEQIHQKYLSAAYADRLVKSGLSARQACQKARISRDTLARYQRGELADVPKIRYPHLGTKLRRCPGCGGRVYMPCLACQLRGRKK